MRVTFGKINVGQHFKVNNDEYYRIKECRRDKYGYVNAAGPEMYPGDKGYRYFHDDQIVDSIRERRCFPSATLYYGNSPVNAGDPVYVTIEWFKESQYIAKRYMSPEAYVEKIPSNEWIFEKYEYQAAEDWAESHFIDESN